MRKDQNVQKKTNLELTLDIFVKNCLKIRKIKKKIILKIFIYLKIYF